MPNISYTISRLGKSLLSCLRFSRLRSVRAPFESDFGWLQNSPVTEEKMDKYRDSDEVQVHASHNDGGVFVFLCPCQQCCRVQRDVPFKHPIPDAEVQFCLSDHTILSYSYL